MLRHDLGELAGDETPPPRLVQFHRDPLDIQNRVGHKTSVPDPIITEDAARQCMSEGRPLLGAGGLNLDSEALGNTYHKVKATFCRYRDLFAAMPDESEPWPGEPVTNESLRNWPAGAVLPGAPPEDARRRLLMSVALVTLRPFLGAFRDVLLNYVDQESCRRRHCPARIAVLGRFDQHPFRLKCQRQINKLSVVDLTCPPQGLGTCANRRKSVTRAVMGQISRADTDCFFVFVIGDNITDSLAQRNSLSARRNYNRKYFCIGK